ncbi:hypothetical protein [uncultured Chryseobacterium sp.]|uniref:hypothetical protein n=1 Tax=uncultured Chryseobacterium sp. TaxID=259322 RepID=UPI0025E71362|nr:hypothetical protein [uncultured Chryseobacterium sp.]
MKPKVMYIENKFRDHSGPAWIGFVEFSKSGQTVYFNNKALKKLKVPGISGNHFDIETGEEYWVSGVKKNGQDRHWAGGGKIMLDKKSVSEYLKLVDFTVLDENHFELVDFEKTDKARFNELENAETFLRNRTRAVSFYDNNRRKLISDLKYPD